MGNITYVKGSLFDAPKGSIIAHACNTKGVWGSGIAKTFAEKYPTAKSVYSSMCKQDGSDLIGTCLIIKSHDFDIACLFTSVNYGDKKDKPSLILDATHEAIGDLIDKNIFDKPIHMCKINSGFFGVPWEQTAKILNEFSDVHFTVWEL